MSKSLAVFAFYDKFSRIAEYVVWYLSELKKVADIIFVADNELSAEELAKIKNLTLQRICVRHGEYDFGSYKRGYLYAAANDLLDKYDGLILCNDSCFGPFYPLENIVTEMNAKGCDFWGMFKHLEQGSIKEHVQSYFMYLKSNVVSSKVFDEFMRGITRQNDKNDIIIKYEIGLSQALINAGYRGEGLFEYGCNLPHGKHALEMIGEGFPFLKRSLFVRRYFYEKAYCRGIWRWKEVINRVCPQYDTQAAEQYLIRQLGREEYRSYLRGLRFYYLVDWRHFLLQKKRTSDGRLIVKICKIPLPWVGDL